MVRNIVLLSACTLEVPRNEIFDGHEKPGRVDYSHRCRPCLARKSQLPKAFKCRQSLLAAEDFEYVVDQVDTADSIGAKVQNCSRRNCPTICRTEVYQIPAHGSERRGGVHEHQHHNNQNTLLSAL